MAISNTNPHTYVSSLNVRFRPIWSNSNPLMMNGTAVRTSLCNNINNRKDKAKTSDTDRLT